MSEFKGTKGEWWVSNNDILKKYHTKIANYNRGNDFYACEIDKEKFNAQELRFKNEIIMQPKLIFEN